MSVPLAERIRPKTLDDIVGQTHLLGENKPLRRIIESGKIPNMIFYGPSGVGKTTVARMIANNANMTMHKLNGTSASIADIKQIVAETETLSGINGILLYLDEIQYLNKKQQQSLLEYIENGKITLIASTTENPYFYVYNAIISRSTVFEFKPLTSEEILPAIKRAFQLMADELGLKLRLENGVLEHIARGCGGDVRKSINTVELCILSADNDGEKLTVNLDNVKLLTQRSNMRYDRALHYAARLMEAGDIISLCRRLLVIASEDIGLAYPMAAVVTKSCVDSALQLGLPEARIPLAEAVVLLATAPKSNSAESAIDAALADVRNGDFGDYPRHLQNKHFDGEGAKVKGQHYLYPHDFPNHWVKQQYLPDKLVGRTYYQYGENKTEQMAKAYWEKIKK